MLKKHALLILCLFFVAVLTSACGGGGKATPPNNSALYYLLAQQNNQQEENNNEEEPENTTDVTLTLTDSLNADKIASADIFYSVDSNGECLDYFSSYDGIESTNGNFDVDF